MTTELFIGLMSGTSADGIDVALVSIDDQGSTSLVKANSVAHEPDIRAEIESVVQSGIASLERASHLDVRLADVFAQAALTVVDDRHAITAIGSHGQTVLHRPELGFSVQLGSGAVIAERTGITTVCDFRARDLAAYGQGAPLVPAFHQTLFARRQENVAVVNIGGISNVTLLTASQSDRAASDFKGAVQGFDCGPGNTLLDLWARQHLEQDMDINGAFAASGTVNKALLKQMMHDSYFHLAPPKSTGREYFNEAWLQAQLQRVGGIAPNDVQATLSALTCTTISDAIKQLPDIAQVYVCGGGVHNTVLMHQLQEALNCPVESTSTVGVSPDDIEAMAFAWLAWARLHGVCANVPAVTGAQHEVLLGCVWPGEASDWAK